MGSQLPTISNSTVCVMQVLQDTSKSHGVNPNEDSQLVKEPESTSIYIEVEVDSITTPLRSSSPASLLLKSTVPELSAPSKMVILSKSSMVPSLKVNLRGYPSLEVNTQYVLSSLV